MNDALWTPPLQLTLSPHVPQPTQNSMLLIRAAVTLVDHVVLNAPDGLCTVTV